MTHEEALSFALLAALAWSFAITYWARECRCAQCQFHVHERRVAAAKAKSEAETAARKQADLRHEYEHKGGGWQDGDPDRFDCRDDSCRRNRRRVD